jgi:hypothetical protein
MKHPCLNRAYELVPALTAGTYDLQILHMPATFLATLVVQGAGRGG